ncbi:hypothetical protein RRG08_026929 [Elysia crispata]|uniref:Ig-like domain-containing protein n=1 Tax=Elysia crispata TaxID=231223 RepID=A0AAE0Z6U7_9GAST|nr:hypothetical protein RRG08_026929 [Elysia crispata]
MERGIPFWLLLFLMLRLGETISQDDTINVNATVGSTAILPCRTVSNVHDSLVTWSRKGENHPLTIDSRRFVNDNSSDVTAQEGVTVTLVCRATGIPPPKVTWFSLPPDLDVRETE